MQKKLSYHKLYTLNIRKFFRKYHARFSTKYYLLLVNRFWKCLIFSKLTYWYTNKKTNKKGKKKRKIRKEQLLVWKISRTYMLSNFIEKFKENTSS